MSSSLFRSVSPRNVIFELRRAEILKKSQKKVRARAGDVRVVFKGVAGNFLTYETKPSSREGQRWTVKVALQDLRKELDKVRAGKATFKMAVRRALKGDLKVMCNCPAMLYWGYAYIASKGKYKVGRSQDRYPKVRNPKLQGSSCKHVYRVLKDLPQDEARVLRAFKRAKVL